jgi:4-hydroxy-4-methyl-2-oxoglutarate aldolase
MVLAPHQLEALGRLTSTAVADAIETFDTRLRNEGFADGTVHCWLPDLPPMVGYAATVRVRTAIPPLVGGAYVDRTDWWQRVLAVSAPRVLVIEDTDAPVGTGALIGGLYGSILRALGVVGVVTNGAVRDLDELAALRVQAFARHVVPSHAYAHVFEYGVPVRIGGLEIAPGSLLHGDRNGIVAVPEAIAAEIPQAAATRAARDARIIALCRSTAFSLDALRELLPDAPSPPREDDRSTNEASHE